MLVEDILILVLFIEDVLKPLFRLLSLLQILFVRGICYKAQSFIRRPETKGLIGR